MKRYFPTTIRRDAVLTGIILLIWIAVSLLDTALFEPKQSDLDEPPAVVAVNMVSDSAPEQPDEAEQIEAALVEQGYFRDDISLSYELQDYLHTAAEEAGIPYELALAVVKQETDFRNIVGDDGASAGYMQIQEKWHSDRMERLGVTDLMEPYGNFRVGCDFLAEIYARYENWTDALTHYNSGHGGASEYASSVIEYWEVYE